MLATPGVRALAREHGVDLNLVQGSGPAGRVERHDVLAAIASTATDAELVPAHRIAIAARLTRAACVPQFSLGATVDLTRALSTLAATPGATVTHLLLRAVGAALREHPALNRTWEDDGPRLAPVEPIRVGLAVAADDRLLVPTLAEPDREPLAALVGRTGALVERGPDRPDRRLRYGQGRRHRLQPRHVRGRLVPGDRRPRPGGDPRRRARSTAARSSPTDGIVAVPQIELMLTVDHRVADGVAAARFLQAVTAKLA